jgi:hypothetical protein
MENKFTITRRHALGLGAAAMLAPNLAMAAKASPVLVELFTSQGCSSCPPADELAGELVKDPNNLVLSFNVDYWDYLGWRDTLAKPEYTQRQYDYAKSRGDGSVYTPQMIINGTTHAVGNRKHEVTSQIAVMRNYASATTIDLRMSQKEISLDITAGNFEGEATLWLMAVEPKVQQKIERGENAGSSIAYVNVVRNLVPAAMWKGEAYKGSWMRDAVMTSGKTFCVAVLQQNKVGPVLALARAV